jgi:hypothetical protein
MRKPQLPGAIVVPLRRQGEATITNKRLTWRTRPLLCLGVCLPPAGADRKRREADFRIEVAELLALVEGRGNGGQANGAALPRQTAIND